MNKTSFHRRKYLKKQKENYLFILKRILRLTPVLFVLLFIFVFIYFYTSLNKRFVFSKSLNIALIYQNRVRILNYDPKFKEMLVMDIDGDINFNTSSNKGRYPLKNIYNLSINEKTKADLFRKTLMKNLHLPIHNVFDCRHTKADDHLKTSEFIYCRTDKYITDLLFILFVRWNVGKNITYKTLTDYGVIVTDSEVDMNYLDDSKIFEKLEFDFSMDLNMKDVVNIEIYSTVGSKIPLYFDDLIKISGGRVVNTKETEGFDESDGCEIRGGNEIFMKYLKNVFNCRIVNEESEGNPLRLIFSKANLETY